MWFLRAALVLYPEILPYMGGTGEADDFSDNSMKQKNARQLLVQRFPYFLISYRSSFHKFFRISREFAPWINPAPDSPPAPESQWRLFRSPGFLKVLFHNLKLFYNSLSCGLNICQKIHLRII